MPFDARDSLRPELRELPAYVPVEPPEQAAARYGIAADDLSKLDGNEHPLGPSPGALAALARPYAAHRYPDPDQRRLRAALAARHDVPAETIVCGAGADELIDQLFRAYVAPGDRVVVAPPTFGMYAFDAELHGAQVVTVPRQPPGWDLDIPALVAAASAAKIVFIPSPNNPTGNLLPPEAIDGLLDSGALIVIDEAYIEFAAATSLAGRAAAGAPLVVLRTFSKWAGLAGLRVGYGVMPPQVAAVLMQVKQPYSVSVAAEAAALASLDERALLDARAQELIAERDRMAGLVAAGGWLEPVPSQANFILCRLAGPLAGMGGAALRDALARRGVLVRYFDTVALRDHVRISVGTAADTDRLLAALLEITTAYETDGEPRRDRGSEQ